MTNRAKDKLKELLKKNGEICTDTKSLVMSLLKSRHNNGVTILHEMQQFYSLQAEYQEKDPIFCAQYKNEGLGKLKRECYDEAKDLFDKAIRHCVKIVKDTCTADKIATGANYTADNDTIQDICTVDREKLAELFALRSECSFASGSYHACIDDIANAFSMEYAGETYVLYDRQGKCFARLGLNERAIQSFQQGKDSVANLKTDIKQDWTKKFESQIISSKTATKKESTNENVRSSQNPASSCATSGQLKIKCSDLYGHYLEAREDIRAGTEIIKTFPVASVLFEDCFKSNCYACFTTICTSYPCRGCSGIVYCSSVCEERSWTENHRYECRYQDWLAAEWCAKLGHLTVRLALKTLQPAFRASFPEFQNVESTEFYDSQEDITYRDILVLVRHEESRNLDTSIQMLAMCILLYEIIHKSGFLQHAVYSKFPAATNLNSIAITRFMLEHLLMIMQTVQCNGFTIAKMRNSTELAHSKPRDMGLGLYLYSSYFNHSCDPHVDFTFHGDVMVGHTIKDVKHGEQVFCDYGYNFYLDERKKRQDYMKSQFFFDCNCKPCEEDWPLWDEIESKRPQFKCQGCGLSLDITQTVKLSSVMCSKCKCTHDIARLLPTLSQSHETYRSSMELALAGCLDQALPGLLSHLSLLQATLQQPWREYYGCQATVKQCIRLRGNIDQ